MSAPGKLKTFFNTHGATAISDEGIELLEQMLMFDPNKRISAQ